MIGSWRLVRELEIALMLVITDQTTYMVHCGALLFATTLMTPLGLQTVIAVKRWTEGSSQSALPTSLI